MELLIGVVVGAAVVGAAAATRPHTGVRGRAISRPGRRHAGRALPAAGAVVVLAVAVSPLMAVAAAGAIALAPRWRARRTAARNRRAIAAAYPDAIDLVVLGVRAGLLPAAALAESTRYLPAPVRPAFDAVVGRVGRGERFADALAVLDSTIGPTARPLIDSFAAAERYGLPLAPVLDRLATEARQQRRRDADAAARQLPVRMSLPLVLCTLPSFVLLAIVPLLLGAFSSLHTQ